MLFPLHLHHQYVASATRLSLFNYVFFWPFHHWRSPRLSVSPSRNLLSSVLLCFWSNLLCLLSFLSLISFSLKSSPWTSECFLRWTFVWIWTLNIVPPHIVVIFQTDFLDGVLSLWKNVAAFGLMGEVLSTLQTELLAMFKGVEDRTEKTNLLEAGETWLKRLSVPANLLSEMFFRV